MEKPAGSAALTTPLVLSCWGMMHYLIPVREIVVGQLLNAFVDICLLRTGPQQLPSSVFLLSLTVLLGLMTGTLAVVESFGSLEVAAGAQLMDLMLLLSLLWIGLRLTGKGGRFFQTGAALCGSGTLINLVAMPLQLVVSGDPAGSLIKELGVLVYLFLIIWALVVAGHILRHAFEIRLVGGVLLAIGYFLLVNLLVQNMFPVA